MTYYFKASYDKANRTSVEGKTWYWFRPNP